jgi:hypothetical protein
MLDTTWLSKWIAAEHLGPGSIDAYRRAYLESPVRMVVIRDFLRPEIAAAIGGFLTGTVRFDKVFGLYSRKLSYGELSEAEWAAADEADRFYRFGRFFGLPAETRIYSLPLIALDLRERLNCSITSEMLTFLRFYFAINDRRMGDWFGAVADRAVGPSLITNVNEMREGDFIAPHSDRGVDPRRLSVVTYFTPEWRPEFGGALCITDGRGVAERVETEFNSLIIFDVQHDTKHHVEPVSGSARGRGRTSVSGWTLDPAARSSEDP